MQPAHRSVCGAAVTAAQLVRIDRRRELARIILRAEALGLPHHCIVNNNAEGCAPRTIAALAQTVAETRARATAS